VPDAGRLAPGQHLFGMLGTVLVAQARTGHAASERPASVAVHDQAHVPRERPACHLTPKPTRVQPVRDLLHFPDPGDGRRGAQPGPDRGLESHAYSPGRGVPPQKAQASVDPAQRGVDDRPDPVQTGCACGHVP
jgi:hypothetical protein